MWTCIIVFWFHVHILSLKLANNSISTMVCELIFYLFFFIEYKKYSDGCHKILVVTHSTSEFKGELLFFKYHGFFSITLYICSNLDTFRLFEFMFLFGIVSLILYLLDVLLIQLSIFGGIKDCVWKLYLI